MLNTRAKRSKNADLENLPQNDGDKWHVFEVNLVVWGSVKTFIVLRVLGT
jgi:hypothetical protein